jgi:hypothetical protein
MKKLVLSAAILLGSLTTFAAITPVQNTEVKTVRIADEFKEIDVTEVPVAVSDALKTAYPDAVITKAFMNESKQYRIDIKTADQEGSLFADETGKWIQM